MSTALAAVQIVFLLSGNGFQAVLPAQSMQPSPVFANNQAGAVAGMEWVSARLPPDRGNAPPKQVCAVGMEVFTETRYPFVTKPLHGSKPPFRALEPYAATFHYISEEEAKKGVKRRTAAQALALCGVKPKAP
ncbi:MAG: hypothetical protein ACKOD9_14525 [Rubrivivax sp.]